MARIELWGGNRWHRHIREDVVAIVADRQEETLRLMGEWIASSKEGVFYAELGYSGRGYGEHIRMHNVCWELEHGALLLGKQIDHVDHDTLNNDVDTNLRLVSVRVQLRNRRLRRDSNSGKFGVCWNKDKWRAYVRDGRELHLGYFQDLEVAARVRDSVLIQMWDENVDGPLLDAYLNNPRSSYPEDL